MIFLKLQLLKIVMISVLQNLIRNITSQKAIKKPFRDFRELSYKKPSRPYKKLSFSKKKDFRPKQKIPFNYKEATCYKCGKKCHTTKFCRMNRKLHELGFDEDVLSKVAPLLIESSDSKSFMTGDSEPLQIDESIDSETSVSSDSSSDSESYLKKINVLTKEIFVRAAICRRVKLFLVSELRGESEDYFDIMGLLFPYGNRFWGEIRALIPVRKYDRRMDVN